MATSISLLDGSRQHPYPSESQVSDLRTGGRISNKDEVESDRSYRKGFRSLQVCCQEYPRREGGLHPSLWWDSTCQPSILNNNHNHILSSVVTRFASCTETKVPKDVVVSSSASSGYQSQSKHQHERDKQAKLTDAQSGFNRKVVRVDAGEDSFRRTSNFTYRINPQMESSSSSNSLCTSSYYFVIMVTQLHVLVIQRRWTTAKKGRTASKGIDMQLNCHSKEL